jgi:hypothetical protein
MSQFDHYKAKKPEDFLRLVSVSYGTFTLILVKLQEQYRRYLLEKPRRNQGRKCQLSLADQLLLCLLYLRTYHTFFQLGMQFGISESYAQKRYSLTKKQLLGALELPDEEALQQAIAGDCAAIDVTEQPIERPKDDQNAYYSGKKRLIPSRYY